MALPNPIAMSIPTTGTAISSLTKVSAGTYQLLSGTDFVMQAKLYVADPSKKSSTCRLYVMKDYSKLDAYPTSPSGKMSGNFSCSFTQGTDVTEADIVSFIQQVGSLLAQSLIASALVQGSTE